MARHSLNASIFLIRLHFDHMMMIRVRSSCNFRGIGKLDSNGESLENRRLVIISIRPSFNMSSGIHGIYSCTSAGTSGCVRLIKNELKPVHVREIQVFSCDVRIVGWDVRPIRMPRIRDRNGKTCPREYFFKYIIFFKMLHAFTYEW